MTPMINTPGWFERMSDEYKVAFTAIVAAAFIVSLFFMLIYLSCMSRTVEYECAVQTHDQSPYCAALTQQLTRGSKH